MEHVSTIVQRVMESFRVGRKLRSVEANGCYVVMKFDNNTGSTFLMGDDDAALMLVDRINEIASNGHVEKGTQKELKEITAEMLRREPMEEVLRLFDEAEKLIAEGRAWINEAAADMEKLSRELGDSEKLRELMSDQMELPGVSAERRCPACGQAWMTDSRNLHPDKCLSCGWTKPPSIDIGPIRVETIEAEERRIPAPEGGWPQPVLVMGELGEQREDGCFEFIPKTDAEMAKSIEQAHQTVTEPVSAETSRKMVGGIIMEKDPETGNLIFDDHTQVVPEGLDLETYKQRHKAVMGMDLASGPDRTVVVNREHYGRMPRKVQLAEFISSDPRCMQRLDEGWQYGCIVNGERVGAGAFAERGAVVEIEWSKARDEPDMASSGVPENTPGLVDENGEKDREERPKVERCPGSLQPATKRRGGSATTAICPACHKDIATKPVASMLLPVFIEHNRVQP